MPTDLLTLLWVLIYGVAFVVSVLNLSDAWADYRGLPSTVTNGRRLVATGWVRREVIRTLHQATGLALGVLVFFDINPPGLGIVCLIGMGLLMLANTVLDYRQRKALNKTLGIRQ